MKEQQQIQELNMPNLSEEIGEQDLRNNQAAEFWPYFVSAVSCLPEEVKRELEALPEYSECSDLRMEMTGRPDDGEIPRGGAAGFKVFINEDAAAYRKFLSLSRWLVKQVEAKLDAYFGDVEARQGEYLKKIAEYIRPFDQAYLEAQKKLETAKEEIKRLDNKENKKRLKEARKALKSAKRDWDEASKLMSPEAFEKNLKKAREVVNGSFTSEMHRILRGDTPSWLTSRDPFFRSFENSQAILNNQAKDLPYRIAVTEKSCPIYEVVREADQHVDKQIAYWNEKKAGTLTKEKEEAYRRSMYAGFGSMLKKTETFFQAIEAPEDNIKFHKLGLSDSSNEPFELHRYSKRGLGMFEDTLRSQMTGIENNWHTDDLGVLAIFFHVYQNMERSAAYTSGTKRADVQKLKQPTYPSQQHKEYAERLGSLWKKIEDNPLQDERDRSSYLEQMRALISEGYEKKLVDEYDTSAFELNYQRAKEREKLIRAGKEEAVTRTTLMAKTITPETVKDLQSNIGKDFINVYAGLASALKNTIKLDIASELEVDSDLSMESFNIYSDEKTQLPTVTADLFPVIDQDSFETFRAEGFIQVQAWNEAIDQKVPDGPDADKIRQLFRAAYTNKLERGLMGFPLSYINKMWPSNEWATSLLASVYMTVGPEMSEHLRLGEKELPVHDLLIESDQQVQVVIDYMQEAGSGQLPKEREQLYRQKLYDQAVSLMKKLEIVDRVGLQKPEVQAKYQDVHLLENPAFNLTSVAPRGCGSMKCFVQAQIDGLENGWAIPDLKLLGAFHYMTINAQEQYHHNATLKAESFERYQPPKFPSKGCENYFKKLEAFYEKMTSEPLTGQNQRTKWIDGMYKLTLDGLKKGYLDKGMPCVQYMMQAIEEGRSRDKDIQTGMQRAADAPVQKEAMSFETDMELQIGQAWESRGSIFSGQESDYHKNLRLAAEAMKERKLAFSVKKPPENATPEQIKETEKTNVSEAIKLLDAIDAMDLTAKIYKKERGGAKSDAGKTRLEGARKVERMAQRERMHLIKQLNEGKKTEDHISLLQLQRLSAVDKGLHALEQLQSVKGDLFKAMDKETIRRLAADVLVMQLSSSKQPENAGEFEKKGPLLLRETIIAEKEFRTMINRYLDKKKSGQKLVEDLIDGTCMKELANFNRQMKANQKLREDAIEYVKKESRIAAEKALQNMGMS